MREGKRFMKTLCSEMLGISIFSHSLARMCSLVHAKYYVVTLSFYP